MLCGSIKEIKGITKYESVTGNREPVANVQQGNSSETQKLFEATMYLRPCSLLQSINTLQIPQKLLASQHYQQTKFSQGDTK